MTSLAPPSQVSNEQSGAAAPATPAPAAAVKKSKSKTAKPALPEWTAQDDQKLTELHAQHNGDWKLIAKDMGRSLFQCTGNWSRMKMEKQRVSTAGDASASTAEQPIKKKKTKSGETKQHIVWTKEEDETLLHLYKQLTESDAPKIWAVIAAELSTKEVTRTPGACKARHKIYLREDSISAQRKVKTEAGSSSSTSTAPAAAAAGVAAIATNVTAAVAAPSQKTKSTQSKKRKRKAADEDDEDDFSEPDEPLDEDWRKARAKAKRGRAK